MHVGFWEGLLKVKGGNALTLLLPLLVGVLGTEKSLSWYRGHHGLSCHMGGSSLLEAGSYAGACAPWLQPLGHYEPLQHGTRFVDSYVETESRASQILKERLLGEDGNSETHQCTFQTGWRSVCMTSLRTDKEMGTFWAWFGLQPFAEQETFWVSWKASEQECSQPCPPRLDPCS